MRLRLIACEIFLRELCSLVAQSPNTLDVEFLPKGLHDIGAKAMRERLQKTIDADMGRSYDAVLMAYGLCNNGVVGLRASTAPLVIPRGHDCITLFMGSRHRYMDYFSRNPGVYYFTSGWIERGADHGDLTKQGIPHMMGFDKTYEELVNKYGEEDALYLYDEMTAWMRHYRKLTYIEMGIEPDDRYLKQGRDTAGERGWEFEVMKGDMSLLRRLVDGPWGNSDFLTVPPGHEVTTSFDEQVICSKPSIPSD